MVALLKGPVVFIDDEVDDDGKPAFQLAEQIRATGRPLAKYSTLPPPDHARQWESLAFLVLDWDLVPTSPGAVGGSALSAFARESLYEWLCEFVEGIYCPVFIVSSEDVADIQRQLADNADLQRIVDTGRLKVFPKQVLMDDFIGYLEGWVSSTPALAALNIWANEYEAATNRLFQDMEQLSPDWPAYVWRTAEADGVDPSFELASVLSANLIHRIDTLVFDIPQISSFEGPSSGPAMRRVSQGRTTLPAQRLYPSMVLPGDIFSEEDGSIWLNTTPACHTVLNRPASAGGDPDPESVVLHLIRGTKVDAPASKSKFDELRKKYSGPNTVLVHTLLNEEPYVFHFKDRQIAAWGQLAERRIGRLLPPYITLIQQKHAAFLMNEGLPSVQWALYEN